MWNRVPQVPFIISTYMAVQACIDGVVGGSRVAHLHDWTALILYVHFLPINRRRHRRIVSDVTIVGANARVAR